MKDFQKFIEPYAAQLPITKAISTFEAEKRAGVFLEAMAQITTMRHEFSEQKIKFLSVQTAVYSEELAKGTAKTMTENKVTAEASKAYETAREDLERIDNDLSYLRAYYDIFNNAHIFFRQLSKGEQF
jgi:hypothetical protein